MKKEVDTLSILELENSFCTVSRKIVLQPSQGLFVLVCVSKEERQHWNR